MTSRKITHIVAGVLALIAVVFAIIIPVFEFQVSWWWLVAALVAVIIGMYTIPPLFRYSIAAIERKRKRRYLHASYRHISKKLKLPSDVYQTSWFYARAQDSCLQDFSQFHHIAVPNLPANISVYHVEGALVWLVRSNESYDDALFIEWLKEIRPKQPVNGVMLILDAFSIVQRTHKETDAFIEEFKFNCEDLYHRSDILSQLHVFVSGINKLDGVAEAIYEHAEYADLSIDLSNDALNKTDTFTQAYDQLFKSLFVANIKKVSLQLDDGFKRKQLLGPMQLQYLRLSIEQLFSRLQSFDGSDLPYSLTSFHLVESEQASQRINLATAHALISVNQIHLPVVQGANLKVQASLQKAFTHGVLPTSFKAPVNKFKVFFYWLKQSAMITAGAAFLSFVTWIGYQNYQYNEELHAQFEEVHEAYKKTLDGTAFNVEEPDTILLPLTMLHKAYEEFKLEEQNKPWFVLPFIVSLEREKHYKALYQQQLYMVFKPILTRYLEEELFVYLELEDYLKVLNVENVYESLAAANMNNKAIIVEHFQESFLESGVLSREQIGEFTILLEDLFALGYEPFEVNNELIAIVDAEISTQNRFQLLYQYIESLPEFNQLNDIRATLFGQDVPQNGGKDLLYFDQSHASFLVPNLYTPGGLLQLSFLPESGFFKTMVKRNHGLFRKIPEPRDMERLGSYLKYTYINEYVGFWRTYLTHIKAREGVALKALLTQLTQEENSPLQQLNTGIRHFVNIPQITIEQPEEKAGVQAPKKFAAKAKKVEAVASKLMPEKPDINLLMAQEQNEISTKINNAFDDNILLSGTSKQVDAIYQSLHKDLIALKKWLDNADNEVIPGKAYFEDITKTRSYQEFSSLWINAYNQPLIDGLVSDIVKLSSKYTESKVADYLNNQWQSQVANPYHTQLAPYFPFSDSEEAVNVRAIDKFFAPDSALVQFEQKVLSQFVEVKGQRQLALFGKQHVMTLNSQIAPFTKSYRVIRDELYNGKDNISAAISFTPVSMAPELMSFSLTTFDKSIQFTHGPLIGAKTVWPKDYQEGNLTIDIVGANNKRISKSFDGVWGPMQMLAEYQNNADSDIITIPYEGTSGVKLKVNNADKQSSIINPQFFKRLQIPAQVVGE